MLVVWLCPGIAAIAALAPGSITWLCKRAAARPALLVSCLKAEKACLAAVLGRHRDTAVYLDETSFVKNSKASVGVQRQYCGRLGKLDNCQVGVFACLGQGERAALVDFRLFLPQSWADDPERCQQAKVPETERKHQIKAQLVLVWQARAAGLSYNWVGGEIYWNNRP